MTLLEDFRQEFENQRSNQKIPDNTCPLIDKLVYSVVEARRTINAYPRRWGHVLMDRPVDLDEAIERLMKTDELLYDLDGLLEMIREDNERLRELGKDWYEISKGALEALELEDEWKEVPSGKL